MTPRYCSGQVPPRQRWRRRCATLRRRAHHHRAAGRDPRLQPADLRSLPSDHLMEAVAVVIGLFGIATTFAALAATARGEFGMLRHLGFTRRDRSPDRHRGRADHRAGRDRRTRRRHGDRLGADRGSSTGRLPLEHGQPCRGADWRSSPSAWCCWQHWWPSSPGGLRRSAVLAVKADWWGEGVRRSGVGTVGAGRLAAGVALVALEAACPGCACCSWGADAGVRWGGAGGIPDRPPAGRAGQGAGVFRGSFGTSGLSHRWWYITGWLRDAAGVEPGFQLLLFRVRTRISGNNPSQPRHASWCSRAYTRWPTRRPAGCLPPSTGRALSDWSGRWRAIPRYGWMTGSSAKEE